MVCDRGVKITFYRQRSYCRDGRAGEPVPREVAEGPAGFARQAVSPTIDRLTTRGSLFMADKGRRRAVQRDPRGLNRASGSQLVRTMCHLQRLCSLLARQAPLLRSPLSFSGPKLDRLLETPTLKASESLYGANRSIESVVGDQPLPLPSNLEALLGHFTPRGPAMAYDRVTRVKYRRVADLNVLSRRDGI